MENPLHPPGLQPAAGCKARWQQTFQVPGFSPAAMNPGLADPCRGAQREPAVECSAHQSPEYAP